MDLLPRPAQLYQVIHQYGHDLPDLPPRESIILPDLYRSCRTVQIEYRFATSTPSREHGRSMIVWINHNPQSFKPENCRHYTNPHRASRLYFFKTPAAYRAAAQTAPGLGERLAPVAWRFLGWLGARLASLRGIFWFVFPLAHSRSLRNEPNSSLGRFTSETLTKPGNHNKISVSELPIVRIGSVFQVFLTAQKSVV